LVTSSNRALSAEERASFEDVGAMARELEPRCREVARMLKDFRQAREAAGLPPDRLSGTLIDALHEVQLQLHDVGREADRVTWRS